MLNGAITLLPARVAARIATIVRWSPRSTTPEGPAENDHTALVGPNTKDVLQHAIELARDGMAIFSADLRLMAWNRAYRDMFDFPAEYMRIGTPMDVLVRFNAERGVYGLGSADEYVALRMASLVQPTQGMRLYAAPYGHVLELRSVRLHDGGMFFTYSDATAQVKSEEELEAENLTLEKRVRERTDELERLNLELARAKAEAEDANVSKSRFLAAASHDLLQPLSAARLYTTSLRERLRLLAIGEATLTLAANVDQSLEAVEDILGALLEISHLDAGATRTDITTFCVSDVFRQLQMEFEPLARGRALRLDFSPSSLRVTSDRKLLRRMLQNLISNAIKYTPEGRVLVGARRRGSNIRFDIYDTGIGIPPSKQAVIFREFERLPAAVEVSAGVGLGLSIVERLSRVLHHEVELRSDVGKGSVFSVKAPRADTIAAGTVRAAPGVPPRQRALEGLVVAAIDNETPILSAMTVLLQGWDCIVACGTGLPEIETALVRLDTAPNVIVADYHIGKLDGLNVIAALRARYGRLPAVLVTADRSPVIRDLANAADVRVLHKPLKPAALRSLLSQWHLVKAAAE
jgi:signal transduction histidine kinase/CheY-like chemotaxis protein